jgi:hypothetical protein
VIRGAAFVVLAPQEPFDPATGLVGLRNWCELLKLRRRRKIWPWLLPLLLLPLLLLLPRCEPRQSFFGVPIETRSLLLIVDRSSSMQAHFGALRDEAKKVLSAMRQSGTAFANVIAYDSQTQSALGEIQELNDHNAQALDRFLDGLQSGGGTNLKSGLDLAAAEIAKHERPTTLVILTDARDGSIRAMVAEGPKLLERFQGVQVIGNALTPRLFGADARDPQNPQSPHAIDSEERALSELADTLNGHFGPLHKKP